MPFLHAATVALLSVAPPLLCYRARLPDYKDTLWLIGAALVANVSVGFGKDVLGGSGYSFASLVAAVFIALLDCAALLFLLSPRTSPSTALALGFAWNLADSLVRRLPVFVARATGPEYSGDYVEMALTANALLPLSVALVLALSLLRRPDTPSALMGPLAALAVAACALPPLCRYMAQSESLLVDVMGIPSAPFVLLVGGGLLLLTAVHRLSLATREPRRKRQ